ncbi:filamentous hemagglutinin N-terminal domain-containing protein [Nostoc sp. ChiSLP03a]|uniref:two-partner secretion domain-containing protein n=1 Tax=Nostoc sp. ChiSLP03a TaxID=3075380 RepID=UPI002AD554AF|nr:filamentous hemagglutinin N-terminal domain-containing protein [Nostoc sp. ChiSLP03a]MDZ8210824.1 filamentous hemagglutinin N-terminal domain-containing protein [Nostoc sp. ChiSLP03a]
MSIFCSRFKGLGIVIAGAVAFSGTSAIAQITQDGTLPNNSQVTTQGNITSIEGGTRLEGNLFHSFKEFSVLNGTTAEFKNTEGVQNIISRVTGKSISNIDGILKANGTANLFLINPNGIIFGTHASLNIGGSFIATTASSLNFADGTKFSVTEPLTTPLLTVSVPIGLQFGATAAPIRNQSQAANSQDGITTNIFQQPVGLKVNQGRTLAFVGGDITLEGGNLTAASGQIELGSVANNSLVTLKPIDQGWSLGYEGVQNFQNIQIIQRIADGKEFPSQVDASGEGGGNIKVQGNFIELTGQRVRLVSQTKGDRNGNDLTITAKKLIVQDGAKVATSTISSGAAGNLTVNASESVELIGSTLPNAITELIGITAGKGKAGDITINTRRLRIKDGARVIADSSALIEDSQATLSQGAGGNVTVNALESVELIGTTAEDDPSSLSAKTFGLGESGNATITTEKLIVQDGAEINVSVLGDGRNQGKTSGEINVTTHSILLDKKGQIISNTKSGRGSNISLQIRDLLLMRGNSQITTNAKNNGDGGNITINAPNGFIVATPFGNNDITANAVSGSGGKITITAKNLFGFVPRTGAAVERLDTTGETNPNNLSTSDITAFSQQNPSLNGTVQINSPDADPSKGLVELPVNLVDASRQIVASCSSGGKIARNSFITTGRGGVVADPTEPLIADDAVLADWIALPPQSQNRAGGIQKRAVVQAQRNTEKKLQKVNFVNEPTQIVEAQGWVMDANGNVVLVAQVPTQSPHNSSLTNTSCAAH